MPVDSGIPFARRRSCSTVVEPHACSHAIVELMNDRYNILWLAKTSEYCPEESLINGVVRFGKVDKAYMQRNSFLPRLLL